MKTVFFWIEVLPCLTKPFQNWNLSHMFVPRETRQKGGTLHTYEVVVPASLYVCRALGTLPKQKRPKARWKRWKRFGQIRIDLRLPFFWVINHKFRTSETPTPVLLRATSASSILRCSTAQSHSSNMHCKIRNYETLNPFKDIVQGCSRPCSKLQKQLQKGQHWQRPVRFPTLIL